jgi:hypothetical protein
MKKINKVIDEYLCYEIDCDTNSEDSFIVSVRNKDTREDVTIKKPGVYTRFRNLFRACFV